MLCINSFCENSLHKFWDLESVGVCHTSVISDITNNPVLKFSSEPVKSKAGRYEVGNQLMIRTVCRIMKSSPERGCHV